MNTDPPLSVAVSTAWNARRHDSGKAMIEELLELGFSTVELSVQITPEMIAEVAQLVEEGRVNISSLHNFCPIPKGLDKNGDLWTSLQLSSTKESERKAAVAATKSTIDWAARLGASVVVMHLGDVPLDGTRGAALKLIEKGHTEEAKDVLRGDLMQRAMNRGPYMENLIKSLRELTPYAEWSKVKLGCENRYYYSEIPTIDEFVMIFKQVNSPVLGYWHDVGHAHVAELLGTGTQDDFLRKNSDRLLGMHIHDAKGIRDHQALGKGEIDFTRLQPFVTPETPLVLEVHSQASVEELVESRKITEQLFRQTL